MTDIDAVRTTGAAMGEAVGVFMLHPETFAASLAAGYPDPFSAYFAGRGGALGEATAETVSAVFAVFEPNLVHTCWTTGVAVHGAAGAARIYWEQTADFARRHLDTPGLDRLAALGEKIVAATPAGGLPLFAAWRAMPLDDDSAARALQVMFVLRELRAGVHFNALTISGITPVEAHMLHRGPEYTAFMGWQAPFADGRDKKDLYASVEEQTNRRMGEIFAAALDDGEAAELADLSAGALAALKQSAQPAG